jgi:GntR family transcriptional regulator
MRQVVYRGIDSDPRHPYVARMATKFPNLGDRGRTLASPLHQEVGSVIAAEIERGGLRKGEPLPPERSMCEQLGVSRVTLRKALNSLAERGLLTPSHGRGWFVTDPMLGELPNMLQSLTELADARGLKATSRVRYAHVRASALDEADQLEIGPGSLLYEMQRIRLLDDVPVALDHVRIPLELCPRLPDFDFEICSLYQTLEEHGVLPTRCDFSVQAVAAEGDEVEDLDVRPGTPLLLASGTTFNEIDRPIELSRVRFIGDRYRFRASLYRHNNPSGRTPRRRSAPRKGERP